MNFSNHILQSPNFYDRRQWKDWNLSPDRVERIRPVGGRPILGISLGWSDQSGGVRIISQDVPGGVIEIAPGAPFIGNLITEFEVRPAGSVAGLANDNSTQHTCEILIWYDWPGGQNFPGRGAIYESGTVPAASAASATYVRGRKRITVTVQNLSAVTPITTVDIVIVFVVGATVYTRTVKRFALAANEAGFWEFDSSNLLTTGVEVDPASVCPTNVLAVLVSNNTGGDPSVGYYIEARDY